MEVLKIWLLCIGAAICYGILHDQVTARICVEYFTIGHPPIFQTDSPTLLALGWGVVATWWMGAIIGYLLVLCARVGRWPKLAARDLVTPLAVLLVCMAASAIIAGAIGYATYTETATAAAWARGFRTDFWAHNASYTSGAVGGLVLCGWCLHRRCVLAARMNPNR